MAETDRHEAKIFQLRVVLRGISPLIWRRLLVRSDSTVAQLHEALQVAFGWDVQHLNRFEIRGREYAVYREGGGMIGIDARRVRLDGLSLRRLERFVYEYDFGDGWIHDLRLEATIENRPANGAYMRFSCRWACCLRLQTARMESVSVMFASGLPSTSSRSARSPGAIRPRSWRPNRRAGTEVADCSASVGINPALTSHDSSW
jgi:hypothetical protein